jgi:hypothetical protein
MKKSQIKTVPEFFQNYINLADNVDLMEGLQNGGISLYEKNLENLLKLGNRVYDSGKWTVNQMIEHLSDTERIFLARALRISRNDNTPQPSYDHDAYVKAARSNDKSLIDLMDDYRIARKSTISFFQNLSEKELHRTGLLGTSELSVLAIGFIMIGHPIHHYRILEERYLPLLD